MTSLEQLRADIVARRDELARQIDGIDSEIGQMERSRLTLMAAQAEVLAILGRLDDLPDYEEVDQQQQQREPAPGGRDDEKTRAFRRDVRAEVREYVLSLRDGETAAEIAEALDIRERGVQLALDYWAKKGAIVQRYDLWYASGGQSLGAVTDERLDACIPALGNVSESPSTKPATPLGLGVPEDDFERSRLMAILGSGLDLTLAQLVSRDVQASAVQAALDAGMIVESRTGKYTVYSLPSRPEKAEAAE